MPLRRFYATIRMPGTGMSEPNGTDGEGYLLDRTDWSESLAIQMAACDGLQLHESHWEIIRFVQNYFDEFGDAPPMRVLVRAIAVRLGADKGNSRYLYRLFPEGPAKQVCRYAGLPKPTSCI